MTANEVLAEIIRRALAFDVTVKLTPGAMVESGAVKCGGYFCDDTRTLAVATGRHESTWLGVLLHEYSHLTQWVENGPLWRGYRSEMWDWLAGKKIRDPIGAMRSVQAVEEDCERRTIRLIGEMGAPVDLERYARAANAYLHFHNTMRDKRKWYRDGVVMQEIPSLMAAANPTLDTDFSSTPAALRAELEKIV